MEKRPQITEPYILCYFLNPNKEAVAVVKKVKEMTGLQIVQIDINSINKVPTDRDILSASPEEFVGWIDNATYVVTNSFHCTAFSVLFRKNLLVVKKNTANSRMESLLGKAGLSQRMVSMDDVSQMSKEDLITDYLPGSETFSRFISDSKEYLSNALGATND